MKSHNTRDCILKKSNPTIGDKRFVKDVQNKEIKKSLLINQSKSELFKTVEILGSIAGNLENFVVDSGSDINYINENMVEKLNLNVEEGKPINLVFGDGSKEMTDKKVSECVTFNGIPYAIDFYVLLGVPADFILGNEFLVNNDCTLCYSKRILKIGDQNVITLNNSAKTTDEILGERLSDQIDFFSIPNDSQIVKGCYTCTRVKPKMYKKNKENYTMARKKFERISTDIYGPFNIKDFQCNFVGETGYILSITDIFSRFTRLYLFEKIRSDEVINAIKSWIHEFEKPNYVVSDNGSQFANKNIDYFFSQESIKQILIPEYTPSSNGISERLNQTITFVLTINKGKSLADTIKKAENTINLNYNRTLGSSPMAICKNVDFYDYLGLYRKKFKPKRKKVFEKSLKIGDLVYKRQFNIGKLDPVYETNLRKVIKVGKKGFWVKLSNDAGWTHVKNIKVVKEGSMWY